MSDALSLTGDPELDASVPRQPRVLPEISWLALSSTRVLAAGSLNATLLPARLGETSLFAMLERLDGRHSLAELIGPGQASQDDHRRFLRLLFRAGLLEEAPNADSNVNTPSFHALVMDQTRRHPTRAEAIAASQRPVQVVGASQGLPGALAAGGIQVVPGHTHGGDIAFQLAVLDRSGALPDEACLQPSRPVLPVRLHGMSIDIGPWLYAHGGCTLSDLQRHIAAEPVNEEMANGTDTMILEAIAAHTISLLVAGTSPIVIASSLYRIRVDGEGLASERVALAPLADALDDVSDSLRDRLRARAESSMPALRHVGTKSHEAHHSPRNLLAALEIQEAAVQPLEVLPGLGARRTLSLRRMLSTAFGYTRPRGGLLRRRCPSGGNLGSPEPLIWVAANGRLRVYRYVALAGRLEQVSDSALDTPGSPDVGMVCLGNQEKLARKYGRFSDTLVHLDGGVARAYWLQAARVESVRTSEVPPGALPGAVQALIDSRSYHYKAVWAMRLFDAPLLARLDPARPLARRRLARAVDMRRSLRVFRNSASESDGFSRQVLRSRPSPGEALTREVLDSIVPIMRIRSHTSVQFHRIDHGGLLRPLPLLGDADDLFLQRSLDRAPFAVFLLAPLEPLLRAGGETALDAALLAAGQWVGALWLSLAPLGLGGCPCGAAVESDLLRALPPQWSAHQLLFSFVAGQPGT